MRTVADWFGEYHQSHSHPTNKLLHWICVPPIVLSVMGLLWSVPMPDAVASISPWLNLATLFAAAALAYYVVLSPVLAVGIGAAFALMLMLVHQLDQLPWPLWLTSIAIFVAGWIGQFIGHAIEGKRPSFMKDLQFLLIGPLWLVGSLYQRLGLRY
jgi:uncharacterized membrane protein YGL010W